MTLKQTLEILDQLDHPKVNGTDIIKLFERYKYAEATTQTIEGEKGSTDFVNILIKGTSGKSGGGSAPTMGIIGRLGGIGARPERIGFVSDGDGAAAALTSALKLAEMSERGDRVVGDVWISTHVCPTAPTIPHEPVEFMGAPVDMITMNIYEVLPEMEAIISIDTTKGNNVFNHRGISISPTVKEGYILRISNDLVRILEMVTGKLAQTFALSMQDVTPYGNDIYHINSILQPCTATDAPVVGLAITTQSTVPGSGTGASHEVDIAEAARYCIEVAKEFGQEKLSFHDQAEFERMVKLYGSMKQLQTLGVDET
ncbi:DUF1177 domain-containing protein [Phocicoccus pinnipedialis]|uniref:DUF1177 domain-containing protein n=1 Tax=Phocicoccus pinnipedialis TaxID=110845 RepID=A0A6V7R5I0_9BACL|nr:DUF1177 domain-containing protein [Jeotgalicoccus pinnipedialis]MBP1939656.1 hypothetical protein [Jeotgalicoccus pinnipedialis]CAD2072278.1 hypothetical protein JEOPIN946_00376 [Jeotgalicoccus pinnipedialis]